MKNVYYIFLLLLMLAVTSACRPVTRLVYGVKNPEYEKAESISLQQKKWFGKDFPIVCFNNQAWLDGRKIHVPDVLVFDRLGRFIPYRDPYKPNCNGPAEQFLDELNPARIYNTDDSLTLDKFLILLSNENCNTFVMTKEQGIDFYVFMDWACWTGKKIYKDKTVTWIRAIQVNKNAVCKLILVNMDLQECWTKEEKQKLETAQ